MTDQPRPTVCLLTPFVGGWYLSGLARAVTRRAHERGLDVLVVKTHPPGTEAAPVRSSDVDVEVASSVASDRVVGWVTLPWAIHDEDLRTVARGLPVVRIGERAPAPWGTVMVANAPGITDAVAHLAGHGHERIAFVGACAGSHDLTERREAFVAALAARGLATPADHLVEAEDLLGPGGASAAGTLLALPSPPTAVVAATDATAIGLVRALQAAGRRVPEDVAVVGFDGVALGAHLDPPLTSIGQPIGAVGAAAVDAVLDGGDVGTVHVPTALASGASCGCDPATVRRPSTATTTMDDVTHVQGLLAQQYRTSIAALAADEEHLTSLAWLEHTAAIAGWFASDDEDGPAVPVHGWRRDGGVQQVSSGPLATFPPEEAFALAREGTARAVVVSAVRTSTHRFGALATVADLDLLVEAGQDLGAHAADLLAIALTHRRTMRSLDDAQVELRRAARTDALTGLWNRHVLDERLGAVVAQVNREPDRPAAVLFIDLDDFKRVNDVHGHAAGDAVLQHVAECLRATTRDVDTVVRLGGDEFVVLVAPSPGGGDPATLARRICAALRAPVWHDGHGLEVGATIGIAAVDGASAPCAVLRAADAALYRAKEAGKGTWRRHRPVDDVSTPVNGPAVPAATA